MHISRTLFHKDILTEFVPAKPHRSRKVMIFCSGFPSSPTKDDVLDFWARKGYWTFFPRYRGAWESRGVFLKQSPHLDVLDVVDSLSRPFTDFWSGRTYTVKPDHITVIGTSFGGPAALLASRDPRIRKAVGVSPVVDWVAENKSESLNVLYDFTSKAYGHAYRLNKPCWNKLARGTFYNPVQHLFELDPHKILLLHAEDDDVVRYKPVQRFAKRLGCSFVSLKKGGHLSSSMFLQKKYQKLLERFITSEQ